MKREFKFKIKKEFWLINLGIFLVALDIYLFKTPNKFAMGGSSGLSILILKFFPGASIALLMLLFNFVLLIFAYFILGKRFVFNTLYGSIVLSLILSLLEFLMPIKSSLTQQKLLEVIYSVSIAGLGNALVFNFNSTTGGTDILGKLLSKLFKLKVSYSIMIFDFMIALATGFIFGIETCLFSLLGVFLKSFMMDFFLENFHTFKIMTIISSKSLEIKKFICQDLKRGATIHEAHGAFTNNSQEVITTVLARSQALKLQNYIKLIDEKAFIFITNSSRIIGNGFDDFD
jgi:uncharacterized membrane-anchored protein YitT (DUF2179 family)